MDIRSEPLEVPSGRVARGRVTAPPSKSHAIRALVCAALAEGTSTLRGLSKCDAEDIRVTVKALRRLGFAIRGDRVTGAGGIIPRPRAALDLGGSATAFRFLAVLAALGPGPTTLTGNASLRRRPMGAVVKPLRQLGIHVRTQGRRPFPPLVVSGGPPRRRRTIDVDASTTSQAQSAFILIAPLLPHPWLPKQVDLATTVSVAYLSMTLEVVRQFAVLDTKRRRWTGYAARDLDIRKDWSGATYMLAVAAVTSGDVAVEGVRWRPAEVQGMEGDQKIVSLMIDFGARVELSADGVRVRGGDRRPLDVDLRDAPDLAPLVGALGCVASGTTRVRGAAHLRIKESDRIATVVAAARALGCEARELPDGFEIDGPAKHGGLVVTQHDHRIAMAFAVAGLAIPGVVIDDPACVAKSYPGFWDDLARLTGG